MIIRGIGIAVAGWSSFNSLEIKTAMEETVKRMIDSGVKNPKTIKTAVMLARRQVIAGR